MKNKVFPLLLLIICVGMLAAMVARGEEADPGEHPAMTDLGFSIGDYHFLFFPAKDQPLPHISGGFADYEGPQSNFSVPDSYIAKRVVMKGDLVAILKAVGAGKVGFHNGIHFRDYEMALLLRELDKKYKPVRDGRIVNGYYAVTTAALLYRALFDGEQLGMERWEAALATREPIDVFLTGEVLADRFSEGLNWSGEPQPGELTPTCETGRWLHLSNGDGFRFWPDKSDKEFYLSRIAHCAHRTDDVFKYGQPTMLWRTDAPMRLAYIPQP